MMHFALHRLTRYVSSALLLLAACANCADDGAGASRDAEAELDAETQDAAAALDGRVGMDAQADSGTPSDQDSGVSDSAITVGADATAPRPKRTFVYVGGYGANAFRVYEVNRETLALKSVEHQAQVGESPTYISASANGVHLYLANETDGQPSVTALRVDPTSGVPTRINAIQNTGGKGYVFTALDPAQKLVLAASYNGGNVDVFPRNEDGSLAPRVDRVTFASGAQSHSVRVHLSNKWVYVPNKGLDSVAQLSLNASTGKLTANSAAGELKRDGLDGPRHIAFSPDGKLAFVILELGNELLSLSVEPNGTLRPLDAQPRRPASYTGNDTGAHVLSHPNGKYVYGSNRGSNTIAAFAYDAAGKLTLLEHESTRGQTPRNFDIDPFGEFMVVANQDGGGTLAIFRLEPDGKLTPVGDVLQGLGQPAAVCVVPF